MPRPRAPSSTPELSIELPALPAQQALLRATNKIVAFVGGFGSGKTRAAVYKAIQLGLMNAPSDGIFVEPSYTLVKDVALEAFREVLGELGIPYKVHLTNFTIRIADCFNVLLRSGEEAERLIGVNAGWGIIDEPGKQSDEVGKALLGRIRDPRAKLHQLVLCGTPEGFNWFYDWTAKPDVYVVRAKTTDNPFLPADYVTTLQSNYTKEEVEAYVNGEFVRFEGGWYHVKPRVLPYRLMGNTIKIFLEPEQTSGQLVIGVDTGGGLLRDRTAVVMVDKRDRRLVASWVSNSATIDDGGAVVSSLFRAYTRVYSSPYPGFVPPEPTTVPTVLVESNGIGETMWQVVTIREQIPAIKIKTTEANRYAHMLASKKAVESGIVEGPEELAEEADQVLVENGRFTGPKDLSMALGFCLKFIEENPFVAPKTPTERVFHMRFGKKITSV